MGEGEGRIFLRELGGIGGMCEFVLRGRERVVGGVEEAYVD